MIANECEGLSERQDSDMCPAADGASDDPPRAIFSGVTQGIQKATSKSGVTRTSAIFGPFHKLELECPYVAAISSAFWGVSDEHRMCAEDIAQCHSKENPQWELPLLEGGLRNPCRALRLES